MKNFAKTMVASVLLMITVPAFAQQNLSQHQYDEDIVARGVMVAINELQKGDWKEAMNWLEQSEEYAREHNVELSGNMPILWEAANRIKQAQEINSRKF